MIPGLEDLSLVFHILTTLSLYLSSNYQLVVTNGQAESLCGRAECVSFETGTFVFSNQLPRRCYDGWGHCHRTTHRHPPAAPMQVTVNPNVATTLLFPNPIGGAFGLGLVGAAAHENQTAAQGSVALEHPGGFAADGAACVNARREGGDDGFIGREAVRL